MANEYSLIGNNDSVQEFGRLVRTMKRIHALTLQDFYVPEIEDQRAYFCPVCHSVILSLTLLKTFEQ